MQGSPRREIKNCLWWLLTIMVSISYFKSAIQRKTKPPNMHYAMQRMETKKTKWYSVSVTTLDMLIGNSIYSHLLDSISISSREIILGKNI